MLKLNDVLVRLDATLERPTIPEAVIYVEEEYPDEYSFYGDPHVFWSRKLNDWMKRAMKVSAEHPELPGIDLFPGTYPLPSRISVEVHVKQDVDGEQQIVTETRWPRAVACTVDEWLQHCELLTKKRRESQQREDDAYEKYDFFRSNTLKGEALGAMLKRLARPQ